MFGVSATAPMARRGAEWEMKRTLPSTGIWFLLKSPIATTVINANNPVAARTM